MHECFSLSSFPDEGSCKLPKCWKTIVIWLVWMKVLSWIIITSTVYFGAVKHYGAREGIPKEYILTYTLTPSWHHTHAHTCTHTTHTHKQILTHTDMDHMRWRCPWPHVVLLLRENRMLPHIGDSFPRILNTLNWLLCILIKQWIMQWIKQWITLQAHRESSTLNKNTPRLLCISIKHCIEKEREREIQKAIYCTFPPRLIASWGHKTDQ